MFILVLFGYKVPYCYSNGLYMGPVYEGSDKSYFAYIYISKLLITKEEWHIKEMHSLNNRIRHNDKNIAELDLKLNEETGGQDQQQQQQRKDDKKAPKQVAPKKGGKEVIPSNPDEARRLDLQKENEKNKESIQKYEEKLIKLKETKEKFRILQENLTNGQLVLELCDKTGERKFVKTKLTNDASTFLSDKNSYILGYLIPGLTPEDEEQAEALQIDGFVVRSVEDDVGAIDEPLIQAKKDDKKKAKKK